MKKAFIAVLGSFLMTFSLSAVAGGRAIGTDFVRMLDDGQPVGRSFNVIYQHPTKTGKTVVLNVALGENDDMMVEGGLKTYNTGLNTGVFYQLGIALVSQRNGSDLGFSAALGYEKAAANNVTFFGEVKTLLVPSNGFVYTPMLGVLWSF